MISMLNLNERSELERRSFKLKKMKINHLFFLLLFTTGFINADQEWQDPSNSDSYYVNLNINAKPKNERDWTTLKTLATGAAVGAGTGLLARIIDSSWPGKLFY